MSLPLQEPTDSADLAALAKRLETLERLLHAAGTFRPGDMKLTCAAVSSLTGEQQPEPGWLLANGAAVKQEKWPLLYQQLGVKFNTGGEAADEFRLPNLVDRAAWPKAGSGARATVGATGGEASHVLTAAEMPAHAHPGSGTDTHSGHTHSLSGSVGSATTGVTTQNLGSGVPINDSSDTKGLNATGGNYSAPKLHNHGVTDPGHSHSHSLSAASGGAHSHAVTVASQGGGGGHENMPPYQVIEAVLVFAGGAAE